MLNVVYAYTFDLEYTEVLVASDHSKTLSGMHAVCNTSYAIGHVDCKPPLPACAMLVRLPVSCTESGAKAGCSNLYFQTTSCVVLINVKTAACRQSDCWATMPRACFQSSSVGQCCHR